MFYLKVVVIKQCPVLYNNTFWITATKAITRSAAGPAPRVALAR